MIKKEWELLPQNIMQDTSAMKASLFWLNSVFFLENVGNTEKHEEKYNSLLKTYYLEKTHLYPWYNFVWYYLSAFIFK